MLIIKWLAAIGLLIIATKANAKITESKIDEYCQYYEYEDCTLVKTIIWHESNFNPDMLNPEQSGSYGLMQVQCSTAKMKALKSPLKHSCDQLYDPQINVRFGIMYLKYLKKIHQITKVEDLFAAYNAGTPIVCDHLNRDRKTGEVLCYPGEYINHNYLYGKRGVMRNYKYRRHYEDQRKDRKIVQN